MKILGIETSCDETAVAAVDDARQILAHRILSQDSAHRPFGGVVPEVAARAHLQNLERLVRETVEEADLTLSDLDGIAVTAGPGLIGGVIVGLMFAKGMASVLSKPLIAVNHLEGHALTARLTDDVPFPYLLLLMSGGHCQLLIAEGVGNYIRLGGTRDDALGEAYDKTAKLLGLGFPGGPAVERWAEKGDPTRFTFPTPMLGDGSCDFSFSGLKTAVRYQAAELTLDDRLRADICASFQHAAGKVLGDRVNNAIRQFRARHPQGKNLVIAGGVAANRYLRGILEALGKKTGMTLIAPPGKLCTDNAAMIAWAGIERLKLGLSDSLETEPRARWPLAEG